MNTTIVFLLSILAGFSTILGTLVVFSNENWSKSNSSLLISFAAGVMLTISFLHLIPESLEIYDNSIITTFLGFLFFYTLQNIVMFHPCHKEKCELEKIGILSFIGLLFHSLLDGIAIYISFKANTIIGFMTTIAVILHEIPEGIIITSILLHSQIKRNKTIIYSIIVAIATPLGAVFSVFFLNNLSKDTLGVLLSITAGSFIYLSASDLIPESNKSKNTLNILFFFSGIILIIFISKVFH